MDNLVTQYLGKCRGKSWIHLYVNIGHKRMYLLRQQRLTAQWFFFMRQLLGIKIFSATIKEEICRRIAFSTFLFKKKRFIKLLSFVLYCIYLINHNSELKCLIPHIQTQKLSSSCARKTKDITSVALSRLSKYLKQSVFRIKLKQKCSSSEAA